MKNCLKFAIIGCGRISGHHCRSIMETKGMELTAVCDLIIEKANKYSEQFGIKSYDNYHKMLKENPQINTVVVNTPSGMHYEHGIEFINKYLQCLFKSLKIQLTVIILFQLTCCREE